MNIYLFSLETYVLGTHQKRLGNKNICFVETYKYKWIIFSRNALSKATDKVDGVEVLRPNQPSRLMSSLPNYTFPGHV